MNRLNNTVGGTKKDPEGPLKELANKIKILQMNETKDKKSMKPRNETDIIIPFWGGEIVIYQITKNGSINAYILDTSGW